MDCQRVWWRLHFCKFFHGRAPIRQNKLPENIDFGLGFNPALNSECFATHFYTPSVENPLPDYMRVGMQIMFVCGFFHYHIEGFVWKREAIHRHSIAFK